jgi:hypothetical protein
VGATLGTTLELDQYGSNLSASSDVLPSLRLLDASKTSAVAGGTLGAIEESIESGELDSHLTDPLASWVDDSQQAEGPPAKVARRSAGESEVETVEESEGEELEVQGAVAVGDLRSEVAVATPLAQGLRSKAIYYKRAQTTPATAVRKSARNAAVAPGTSALARAQQLTAEKNLEGKSATTTTSSGKEKGNDFAVLDIFPDSHLSSVVSDSCMLFIPSAGEPGEALSIIRAKEKVQAAIAETARRLAREAEAAAGSEAQGEASEEGSALPQSVQELAPPEAGASASASRAKARRATAKITSAETRSRPLRKCVKASVRAVSTRQYKRRSSS